MSLRRRLADVADAALEVPVVPSFTRIGAIARRRLDDWTPLDRYDLTGRTVVVTGATSGLGNAAARRFASLGALVVVVGRDAARTERARVAIAESARRGGTVDAAVADMGELDQVRALADTLTGRYGALHALVHNAGALTDRRIDTSAGTEATVASQVVGPFLLTSLLLPLLSAAAPGRVITVSSGGMYSAPLTVGQLEMDAGDYKGTEQYARAKRAQVTLNEMWAERVDPSQVVFHAMHPGWADTPGVEAALPTFRRVTGPLLRNADEGADTMVWLAADDAALDGSGRFWHDRRPRSIHKLPSTRKSDTPERRRRLWEHVAQLAGTDAGPDATTDAGGDGSGS